jgi:hypothetical protein
VPDKTNNTLTITDSGIGMTKVGLGGVGGDGHGSEGDLWRCCVWWRKGAAQGGARGRQVLSLLWLHHPLQFISLWRLSPQRLSHAPSQHSLPFTHR